MSNNRMIQDAGLAKATGGMFGSWGVYIGSHWHALNDLLQTLVFLGAIISSVYAINVYRERIKYYRTKNESESDTD